MKFQVEWKIHTKLFFLKCDYNRVAIPSGILVKKLKCPKFWHPVNYLLKLGHETRMFDFGQILKNPRLNSSEDLFFLVFNLES